MNAASSSSRKLAVVGLVVAAGLAGAAVVVSNIWLAVGGVVAGALGCVLALSAKPECGLKDFALEADLPVDPTKEDDVAFFEAVENLQVERHFFESALKAIGTPILVTDNNVIVVHASDSMIEMLGREQHEVVGHHLGEAMYGKIAMTSTEKVINQGCSIEHDKTVTLWDGRKRHLRQFVTCIFDETEQNVIGAVSAYTDISGITEEREKLKAERADLKRVGNEVANMSESMASATEQISASAREQAKGAREQKQRTDSVSTSMEEITATVLDVASNAAATSQAADQATSVAGEGAKLVEQVVDGIGEVNRSTDELAGVLGELDNQSSEIGRIIGVINEIADQTNLLALNAAIEAARAGDAGRGFAVVADEVRKLAEKTMTATKEVETAIAAIQSQSSQAVDSMEATRSQVSQSTDLSRQTGEALSRIMESMGDMSQRIAQIATAAEEQSASTEEVSANIEHIAQIARQADESAEQSATATSELAEASKRLVELSHRFQEDDPEDEEQAESHKSSEWLGDSQQVT